MVINCSHKHHEFCDLAIKMRTSDRKQKELCLETGLEEASMEVIKWQLYSKSALHAELRLGSAMQACKIQFYMLFVWLPTLW